jgi:uncharacterized RDD family membrane protein YckC
VSTSAYAGLVSRLAALALDGLAITVAVLAVSSLPVVTWESVSPRGAPEWLAGLCTVIAWLTPWAYFTVLWWLGGQTVGDFVLGVVVEHRDGHRMSLLHSAVRAAVGLALAPIWLIGLLAVLWDRRRRAWHDVLLRTDVRYKRA